MPIRLGSLSFCFELIEQQMHELNVGGRFGLGQHDGVELFTGAGDHFDDVVVTPLGLHVVDADADGPRRPLESVQSVHDHPSCTGLGARCDSVLEIEKDMVEFQAGGLGHHLLRAAGHGELTATGAFGLFAHG